MKRFATSALPLVLLLATSLARAGGLVSNVRITRIEVVAPNTFFAFFASPATTPASCVSNPNGLVLDSTTATGKSLMAIFLTAYAQGVNVTAGGTGLCDIYSGYETVSYVYTM